MSVSFKGRFSRFRKGYNRAIWKTLLPLERVLSGLNALLIERTGCIATPAAATAAQMVKFIGIFDDISFYSSLHTLEQNAQKIPKNVENSLGISISMAVPKSLEHSSRRYLNVYHF